MTTRQPTWEQPSPCVCNDQEGTIHAHYPEEPHSCARCLCQEWRPSVRPIVEAVKAVREARAALQHAQHVLEANWKHLVKLVGADEQRDYRFEDPPPRGDVMTAAMMALAEHVIAGRDRKVVRARPSDGDGG